MGILYVATGKYTRNIGLTGTRNGCYISNLICVDIFFKGLGIGSMSDSQEKAVDLYFFQ